MLAFHVTVAEPFLFSGGGGRWCSTGREGDRRIKDSCVVVPVAVGPAVDLEVDGLDSP